MNKVTITIRASIIEGEVIKWEEIVENLRCEFIDVLLETERKGDISNFNMTTEVE